MKKTGKTQTKGQKKKPAEGRKRTVKNEEKAIARKAAPQALKSLKAIVRSQSSTMMKKQYLKSGGECRVTFMMPREAAPEASKMTIVGDFNGWDANATPMKRLKSGEFKITLKLPAGKEYRFKYLIDDSRWENDWAADRYDPNPFASDDSVICL